MDVDELRHALGSVVLEAAYLERVLRQAFSALVGSKYAAVVDARMTAAALIEDCERLTRYRTNIDQAHKDAIRKALDDCHDANRARNRVIHDAWATRPGDMPVELAQDRYITVTARTPAEVRQVAETLKAAADAVTKALTKAFGPHWPIVEDELRNELGHDVD